MNHEKKGKVEKNGIVTIIGRSTDQVWVQVKTSEFIGWIISSNVDIVVDRQMYKSVDKTKAQTLADGNDKTLYVLQQTSLREKPKWDSKCI
jgi:uncharacterized protein YgiM (DUF1202 family)